MINALNRSLSGYKDKDTWRKLQLRGMKSKFCWNDVAEVFQKLYEDVLSKPPYGG